MKIAFISNYLNHHQLFFCNELSRLTEGNFRFISTEKIPEYRLLMGYQDYSNVKYNINYFNSEQEKAYAEGIISSYDVVIFGSAPFNLIKKRVIENKLVFHYSERLFKKGFLMLFNPKRLLNIYKKYIKYDKKNVYLLSAGGYSFNDFNLFGLFKNRSFKWGYFPNFEKIQLKHLIKKKSTQKQIRIIWVGRLIPWKHPEMIIPLAERLYKTFNNFLIDVIGIGPEGEKLKELIKKKNLHNNVIFHGALTPEKVRKLMNISHIFIFTSDSEEGWGAVLNEAMNSACAVIVSNKIGSVPYLIKNNYNGLIFKSGDFESFYNKVLDLIAHPDKRLFLSKNAYETISEFWNFEKASQAFYELCEKLILTKEVTFKEKGPLSKAEIIDSEKFFLK